MVAVETPRFYFCLTCDAQSVCELNMHIVRNQNKAGSICACTKECQNLEKELSSQIRV